MNDRVHGVVFAVSILMLSWGLWRIDLSAMLIGVSVLLLALLVIARMKRERRESSH